MSRIVSEAEKAEAALDTLSQQAAETVEGLRAIVGTFSDAAGRSATGSLAVVLTREAMREWADKLEAAIPERAHRGAEGG